VNIGNSLPYDHIVSILKHWKRMLLASLLLISALAVANDFEGFNKLTEQQRFELLSQLTHKPTEECEGQYLRNLLTASRDDSYRVRNYSVILLSYCASSSQANEIAKRLSDMIKTPNERFEVRDTAISAMGGMGVLTPEIKTLLLDYAANSKGHIRREDATLSLAKFSVIDEEILSAIDVLFNSDFRTSHVVALQCYRLLTDQINEKPELADKIVSNLDARLPSGRVNFDQTAVYLIAELSPHSNRLIPKLISMLNSSPYSRKAIAQTLVQIGQLAKQAIPALKQAMMESQGFERKTLEQALRTLEKL